MNFFQPAKDAAAKDVVASRLPPQLSRFWSVQNALLLILWLCIAAAMLLIARHPQEYQWDFQVYYYAGRAFALGENPYSVQTLHQFYHPALPNLDYVYPPLTLLFYKLWAALPFALAYKLWLGLKLLSVAALVLVWHRWFLPLKHSLLSVAFFILAFHATLEIDLRSGNISVFEQLVLWGGLACLLTGRRWVFCACIVVLTQFKLLPIAFLLLLLLGERPHWKLFWGSLAVSLAVLAANWVLYPALTTAFLHPPAGRADERGDSNPATLALLRTVHDMLGHHRLVLSGLLTDGIYLAVCAGIVAATVHAWRQYARRQAPDPRLRIFVFCLVYALVLPRFKSYSYILLLIPTLYLLRQQVGGLLAIWAMALLLLQGADSLPLVNYVGISVVEYQPLLLAYTIWLFFLKELRRPPPLPGTAVPAGLLAPLL